MNDKKNNELRFGNDVSGWLKDAQDREKERSFRWLLLNHSSITLQ